MGILTGVPSGQDTPVPKETQLLGELQRLSSLHRQWTIELKEGAARSRQLFSLPEYRAWYLEWQQRIQDEYAHLSRCYEMVSRVYRTNPKSPLYPRLRDTYLQAKAGFDQLQALHAGMALPDEKLPVIYDRRDGKLTTHLLPAMSRISVRRNLSATEKTADEKEPGQTRESVPGPTPDDMFIQSLQQSGNLVLEYVGTFDLVEIYLLRQPERSYYIMYGWRQSATRDDEAVVEVDPHFIIAGPLSQVRSGDSAWHFEQIIQLSPFPLQLENPLLERVMDAMSRSRTYTRRQP